MAIERHQLRQHLELALQAYGEDLRLPLGEATPRVQAAPGPTEVAPNGATPAAEPAPSPAPAPNPAPRPVAPAAPTAGPVRTASGGVQPAAGDDRDAALAALRVEVMPCTLCKLHGGRNTVVFGEGAAHARVMFVGEAPGAQEDRTGRPFVGPAGQLLDKIVENAMGLRRSEVYIANINKCRPPDNRPPEADEVAACLPYLRRQIEIVRPEVIVCLGRTAAQNLLGTTASTTALRGQALTYMAIPVVVTWHPSYLLREPAHKRETWDDIKRVNRLLGRPEVPPAAG